MLTAWLRALPDGVDAALATATGHELVTRWREPHRRYHNQDHLAAMLSIVEENAADAADPAQVRLAAWFHDAVYDPRRPDNEEASARLAEERLSALGVDPGEVARLVRLTASHDPDPDDRDGALLTDADLAILAAPRVAYDAYATAIRAEYRHVPEDAFRTGRAAVLNHLLALPRLYHVPRLRERWETAARANVARELDALGGHPSGSGDGGRRG